MLACATGCDLLENYYLCAIRNNDQWQNYNDWQLWFAWKLLSLRYKKQHESIVYSEEIVVICLKIIIFAL